MIAFTRLLCLLLLLVSASTQQRAANSKVCKTQELTDMDYVKRLDAKRLHRHLTEQIAGCEYVDGDLIFTFVGSDRNTGLQLGGGVHDMPTDFLDSIVEISGRLLIRQVNLARIELRNLRVIRGKGTNGDDRPAIELSQCPHSMELVMPRLTAIENGDVRIYSATDLGLYCRMTRSVVWSRLFKQPQQRLKYSDVSVCTQNSTPAATCDCSGAGKVACHASCRSRAGCWAGDARACQS